MVTEVEKETKEKTGHGERWCEGCPRCQDSEAGFCKITHRVDKFTNPTGLHPVCRRCGHCVLRGTHDDDISDLNAIK